MYFVVHQPARRKTFVLPSAVIDFRYPALKQVYSMYMFFRLLAVTLVSYSLPLYSSNHLRHGSINNTYECMRFIGLGLLVVCLTWSCLITGRSTKKKVLQTRMTIVCTINYSLIARTAYVCVCLSPTPTGSLHNRLLSV